MKEVRYSRAAAKVLARMTARLRKRIMVKIVQYATDPASQAANVTALKGRTGKRLRIGDWRVIFDETETAIEVLVMGPASWVA